MRCNRSVSVKLEEKKSTSKKRNKKLQKVMAHLFINLIYNRVLLAFAVCNFRSYTIPIDSIRISNDHLYKTVSESTYTIHNIMLLVLHLWTVCVLCVI